MIKSFGYSVLVRKIEPPLKWIREKTDLLNTKNEKSGANKSGYYYFIYIYLLD